LNSAFNLLFPIWIEEDDFTKQFKTKRK
jgi:hypothetical protein